MHTFKRVFEKSIGARLVVINYNITETAGEDFHTAPSSPQSEQRSCLWSRTFRTGKFSFLPDRQVSGLCLSRVSLWILYVVSFITALHLNAKPSSLNRVLNFLIVKLTCLIQILITIKIRQSATRGATTRYDALRTSFRPYFSCNRRNLNSVQFKPFVHSVIVLCA